MSLFQTMHPPFADFLEQLSRGTDGFRFVGRNFRLDEGVLEARARTYGDYGAEQGFADRADWKEAHEDYLDQKVFLRRPPNGPPRTLDPANKERCPETFRHADNFVTYGGAHPNLDLLRVLNAASLASRTGVAVAKLIEAGRELVRSRIENRLPDPQQERTFTDTLDAWNMRCDLRPCFATFYLDQDDLFQARPEDDQADWADQIRDRLGLAHLDPGSWGDIPILLFRYRVGEIPKSKLSQQARPLAVPSVLDGLMSPAFCPAPRDLDYGHTVHLAATAGKPCREVVHPYMDFDAGHLFRVGIVKTPVSNDLLPARKEHLRTLRQLSGRDDYAALTDPEV